MRRYDVMILVALGVVRTGRAQDQPGLSLSLMGGGVGTFQNLNAAGTAYLKGGPYLGGGVRWEQSTAPGLAILVGSTWTRHELGGSRPGTGTKIDLVTAGIDVGFIYVNSGRFSSTLSAGGGGILLREGATGAHKLKVFSRLGLDATCQVLPRVRLIVQLAGTLYTIENFPSTSPLGSYRHRQGDGSIGAGVLVRF